MELLLQKLEPFLSWLIRTSWQASVLVVLVLLAQALFRRWLTPRWRYSLWFLVLLRLVLPAVPEGGLSIFNLAKVDVPPQAVQPFTPPVPAADAPPPVVN